MATTSASPPVAPLRGKTSAAFGRRHLTVSSVTLWALGCAAAVALADYLTIKIGPRLGPYWSGRITVLAFAAASFYSLRKRKVALWVHPLKLLAYLPRSIAQRADLFDRLETWRLAHITLGVIAIVPFWWHVQAAVSASPLEKVLAGAVIALVASGFAGAFIQEFLPAEMRLRPGQIEVRISDVDEGLHALYVQAEEMILGHSEELVQAYLRHVRPLLARNVRPRTLLWATLTRSDPAPRICKPARRVGAALAPDRECYEGLVDIAERKIRLEQNGFDLRLSTGWLRVHIVLAIATFILIAFHVVGVFYFNGL